MKAAPISLRRLAVAALVLGSAAAAPALAQERAPIAPPPPSPGEPYTERVAGTLVTFEMIPVPAGTVQVEGPGERRPVAVAPFWMSKTEVTWDLFEVYAFGLDRPAEPAGPGGADAVSRPTRPYGLPGAHFGHRGYPAVGMSFLAAREFARWLSEKTGRSYRLPTEAEWMHACRQGRSEAADAAALAATAWFAGNARDRTHPAGTLPPNALGLHDMLGNVAEWVVAGADSVAKGGAFDSDAAAVSCAARRRQSPAWNASDPQLPRSRWWLPDAVFVGIRLVAESRSSGEERRP